jgi:hypothetical protein
MIEWPNGATEPPLDTRPVPTSDCDYPEGEEKMSNTGIMASFVILFAISGIIAVLVVVTYRRKYKAAVI